MSESRTNKKLFFVDPEFRAVIPIFNFHISKTLLRLAKKRPFKITINKAFPDVIKSCATINRTETWINKEIESPSRVLHADIRNGAEALLHELSAEVILIPHVLDEVL